MNLGGVKLSIQAPFGLADGDYDVMLQLLQDMSEVLAKAVQERLQLKFNQEIIVKVVED